MSTAPASTPDLQPAGPSPGAFSVWQFPFILVFPFVLLVGYLVWSSMGPSDLREEEARMVYLACTFYASKHEGKLPDTLEKLVPDYMVDSGEAASRTTLARYELLTPGGGFEVARMNARPILREKPVNGAPDVIEVLGNGKLRRVGVK